MAALLFLYLLGLACWLGGIIFFSFFTAPAIFRSLPLVEAGRVVGVIFPRYYTLGYVAGILSCAVAVYLAGTRPSRAWKVSAVLLAFGLILTLYAGTVVLPKAHALRSSIEETNPDPAKKSRFDSLHRLSVMLNGTVLLLDLAALASSAVALAGNG